MKNTVNLIENIYTTKETLRNEDITSYDLEKMKELFPGDLGMKIMFIQNWFSGHLDATRVDTTIDSEPEEDTVAEEPEPEPKSKNRMTKLDAENISRFIAEKCKGRSDYASVINDIDEYINAKFNKKTIRDLLTGKTYKDISSRFFVIGDNGKIARV
jgi:hypothetical protein